MSIHIEERKGSVATCDPDNDKLGKLIFKSNGTIFYTHKQLAVQPEGRVFYDQALRELTQRGHNWQPATSFNLELEQKLQELHDFGNNIHLGTEPLDLDPLWAVFGYFDHVTREYLGHEKSVVIGKVNTHGREQRPRKKLLKLEFLGAVTARYAYTEPGNQVFEKIVPGIGKENGNSLTLVKDTLNGRSSWRNVKACIASPELLDSML